MTEQIDWDAAYEIELPRVYNYFLYKIGDREIAQDLTATTFERAWMLRSRYHATIATVAAWLFGFARNVLKEYLRKYKRNKQRLGPTLHSEEISTTVDVEKSVLHYQEKDLLHELLHELPDREQDLIALRYGAGFTNREIAKLTGLSESNVGSIIHRTVKSLRNKWEDIHG